MADKAYRDQYFDRKNWHINSNDGTNIDAKNMVTGDTFVGTTSGFNAIFQADNTVDTDIEGAMKVHPVPKMDCDNNIPITIGAAATDTGGLAEGIYRVAVLADCFICVGETDADNTKMVMSAGAVEYFYVEQGDHISFIQVSTGGNASVTPASI